MDKAGELLADMELKPGPKGDGNTLLPLAELGVSKMQSSRWQLAAAYRLCLVTPADKMDAKESPADACPTDDFQRT